jgi:cell division septation protein DedD
MGLIKKRVFIVIVLILFRGMDLRAQSPGPWPWQFGTEILNLEQKLANPGISAYERYEALVRLARLKQLSGNISGAAANWLDAAAVNPNDASALVAGAFCLTAIGEWERAYAAIQPLFASGRRDPAVLQAFYLDAYLRTVTYANASPLAALAGDPGFASLRPMVYYTLWQILTRNPNISGAGSADSWKTRLLAEYPGSPEALIAGSGNGGASVSAVQSPMWLLFPGAPVAGSAPPRQPPPAQAVPIPQSVPAPNTAAPVPMIVPSPAPMPPPAPPPAVSPPVNAPAAPAVQTGAFSNEANARTQAEALRKAGFTATVSRKLVNGAERWAVTVPAGQNINKTMQDLKKAGFDSFPVK